jgi:predicted metal-dependent peptidase
MTKKTPEQLELMGKAYLTVARAQALLQYQKFFYYNILKQFRVGQTDKIDTMGVSWVRDKMYMVYSPEFVSYYTPQELTAIIEHEVCHFVFDHVENFSDDGIKNVFKDEEEVKDAIKKRMLDQIEHRIKNIAMDRAINVYLPELPNIRMKRSSITGPPAKTDDGTVTPQIDPDVILGVYREGATPEDDIVEVSAITEESFKRLLKKSGYQGDVEKVEKYQTWRYYYDLLKSCPKIQEEAQKVQQMDFHFEGTDQEIDSTGGDGQQQDGDDAGGKGRPSKSDVNRIIMNAYRDSKNSEIPGHLRSAIEQALDAYNKDPLPWYKVLRKHINKAKKTKMKEDINIRDNYYSTEKMILTSYKNEPLFKVGVIFDVSGSCWGGDIQSAFWNEVDALRKAGAELTIYYTDADVEHIQKINPKKPLKAEDYEGKGGGGTDLDKGIVRSIEDKNNIHIMLSDNWMDFNLTKRDLKGNKVICACNTDAKIPQHYGPTIHIEV